MRADVGTRSRRIPTGDRRVHLVPPVPDRETSQLGTEIDFLLLTSRASANHELLRINKLVMENRLISSQLVARK